MRDDPLAEASFQLREIMQCAEPACAAYAWHEHQVAYRLAMGRVEQHHIDLLCCEETIESPDIGKSCQPAAYRYRVKGIHQVEMGYIGRQMAVVHQRHTYIWPRLEDL